MHIIRHSLADQSLGLGGEILVGIPEHQPYWNLGKSLEFKGYIALLQGSSSAEPAGPVKSLQVSGKFSGKGYQQRVRHGLPGAGAVQRVIGHPGAVGAGKIFGVVQEMVDAHGLIEIQFIRPGLAALLFQNPILEPEPVGIFVVA